MRCTHVSMEPGCAAPAGRGTQKRQEKEPKGKEGQEIWQDARREPRTQQRKETRSAASGGRATGLRQRGSKIFLITCIRLCVAHECVVFTSGCVFVLPASRHTPRCWGLHKFALFSVSRKEDHGRLQQDNTNRDEMIKPGTSPAKSISFRGSRW